MNNWIFNGDYGLAPLNVPMLLLGLLLSFVCGQMTAWVYMITHGGVVVFEVLCQRAGDHASARMPGHAGAEQ